MGFYCDNKYYTTINLADLSEIKDGIEIVNNEEIIFEAMMYASTVGKSISLIKTESKIDEKVIKKQKKY